MMLYNPYDLIIIKEDVIPQEHIEEIMLLTNNTKDIGHATIINDKKEDNQEEDLKVRNTLWYNITDEVAKKLEEAVAGCFKELVVPKYNCQFKAYEPVQFLGYPPGGHYKGHNDGENFNPKTRKWEKLMDTLRIAGINFTNYALHLGHVSDLLQIVVAVLSIYLLIRKIKDK